MSKEMLIPLSEVDGTNKNRLRVNLNLPFGLDEQIGINIKKIDNLRQIGGFKRVIINRDDETGISQIIPQIDGINSDGSIIARKASIKMVPTNSYNFDNDKNNISNRAKWPDLKVKINIDEIKERVLEKGVIRNNQLWSEEINKAIKKSIIDGGSKNLLPRWNKLAIGDKISFPFFYLNPFIFNDFKVDLNLIPHFLFNNIYYSCINVIGYGFEKKGEGYRLSLTCGPEIERAAILNIYGRLGEPIIKAISSEK